MDGIIEFLSLKFGVNERSLDFETLINIVNYEKINIEWIDSEDSNFKAMICWGHGVKKTDHPMIFISGEETLENLKDPSNWFALAHELGHYYLHPFLKYVDVENSDSVNVGRLSGIIQIEADQFATIILIPTKELIDKFEDDVILAFLSKKPYENICKLKSKIFKYCRKRTLELLKIKRLNKKAKRNLLIKVHRFINRVHEKIILYFNNYFIDIDKISMQKKDLNKLLEAIKNVLYTYEEKI